MKQREELIEEMSKLELSLWKLSAKDTEAVELAEKRLEKLDRLYRAYTEVFTEEDEFLLEHIDAHLKKYGVYLERITGRMLSKKSACVYGEGMEGQVWGVAAESEEDGRELGEEEGTYF